MQYILKSKREPDRTNHSQKQTLGFEKGMSTKIKPSSP